MEIEEDVVAIRNFNGKQYVSVIAPPEPTHVLQWGEDMPLVIFEALRNGETATLMNKNGEPHSLVLMDSLGQIRERPL